MDASIAVFDVFMSCTLYTILARCQHVFGQFLKIVQNGHAMARKIQIGIELNTDKDPEMEVRFTSPDIEVPDNVADAAKTLQDYFDLQDVQPGDGEADIKLPRRIPVNFLFIRTEVSVDGNLFIKVSE
jgi:hypothetical protein